MDHGSWMALQYERRETVDDMGRSSYLLWRWMWIRRLEDWTVRLNNTVIGNTELTEALSYSWTVFDVDVVDADNDIIISM